MVSAKPLRSTKKKIPSPVSKVELGVRVEALKRTNAKLRSKNRELYRLYVETTERLEALVAA